MTLAEIIKFIGEFGIMAVICAIFLIQNKKDRQDQSEINKTIFQTMMTQFQELYGYAISGQNGHVLTPEEDAEAAHIDKLTNNYLQQIVKETGASRAMVVRYHNGGKDMAAVSFLKMSVTNEVVNVGYKPVMSDFQNQFRSMIDIVCDQLSTTGCSHISNLDMVKNLDNGTYELLKERGVRAIYCRALTNENNYVIGFIMTSYTNDNDIVEDQEKIHNLLGDKAKQISALLCL